jgi:hypothetical protein
MEVKKYIYRKGRHSLAIFPFAPNEKPIMRPWTGRLNLYRTADGVRFSIFKTSPFVISGNAVFSAELVFPSVKRTGRSQKSYTLSLGGLKLNESWREPAHSSTVSAAQGAWDNNSGDHRRWLWR